jgi:tRNA nucleotidyltransferase (CCA-adding enzyme)
MELISTHIGADFDAFASAVAARRIHPQARLFFPGSREESVRRMLEEEPLELAELRQREVDPAALTRVILCDVRQRDRIGVVGEWLAARPEIELWAYDHHPAAADDLAVAGGRVDPAAGSTSTLLAEELERRALAVDPREATFLLAGIYEDTGSLTFSTAGARDLEAAAWLLRQGGDLATVRRHAVRHLDATHLEVLYRLANALTVHRVHGHRVGLSAIELPGYVDELAPLVNRCLEIFALPLLFALFDEGDRVTVIGRGDLPVLDLGRALSELGGGGHPTAGSARLKGATLVEVRERLLAVLDRALPPAARAADLMTAPPYLLPPGTTVAAAKGELNARRINAAPVGGSGVEEGRVVGAVTRQTLDGALQHGLGDRPVETVMDLDLEWVDPAAPAEEVGERMLSRHPRFILVGDPREGRPLGIVTRMQVLRHLHGRLSELEARIDRRSAQERETHEPVGHLLKRLPAPLRERIERIAQVARRLRQPVYLVGGFARDLLLGRENRDLDLVAIGDGPGFARQLAEELGARVRVHAAFLTAAVVEPSGFEIDVATARSELYRAPAALPEVQTSALRQDLYRRDFTINTLAIRLGPEEAPELIDYFGGRRDLAERTLRVLHSLSFIDDPTRAFRAVRLSLRLGFRIAPETLRLISVALAEGAFARLSGARLRDELALLLGDPGLAVRGVERLAELGLLAVLHPALADLATPAISDRLRERLQEARAAHDWYRLEGLREPPVAAWRLFLLALSADLGEADRVALADRLLLAGEDRRLLTGFQGRLQAARRVLDRSGGESLAPHEVEEALAPLAGEELLLLLALEDETGRAWIRRDLTALRGLALAIRGADLVAAGVPPGPRIGQALDAARRARLDGRIGAESELAFALAALVEGA